MFFKTSVCKADTKAIQDESELIKTAQTFEDAKAKKDIKKDEKEVIDVCVEELGKTL